MTKKELEQRVLSLEALIKTMPGAPLPSRPISSQVGRSQQPARSNRGTPPRTHPIADVAARNAGVYSAPRAAGYPGGAPLQSIWSEDGVGGASGAPGLTSEGVYGRGDSPTNPYVRTIDTDRNWFSPNQPIWPWGPPYQTYGRSWDYPVGLNLEFEPRRRLLCQFLQVLSENSSILRTVIETRKDQVASIPWSISIREKGQTNLQEKRKKEVEELFERPDGHYRFSRWIRLLLEDLFVIDSPTVYIQRNKGGAPFALRVFQGDTIKVIVDDAGCIPFPPDPAYQQIIKGLPMVNFHRDELLYVPFNPRPKLPIYGMSNCEYVYLTCVTEIRREIYQGNFYVEGNIPDMIIESPESWSSMQLAEYQAFFDNLLSGNAKLKSKARFLPSGAKAVSPKGAFGEFLHSKIDEWTARIICAAFRIPPTAFVAIMNRATAETHQQEARDEGLPPILNYLKEDIFDPIVQEESIGFGYDDLEWKAIPKEEMDPETRLTVDLGYLKVGVRSRNEVRQALGEDPIPEPAANEYFNITPQGDMPIGAQPAQPGGGGGGAGEATSPAATPAPTGKGLKKYVIHTKTEQEVAATLQRAFKRAKEIAVEEVKRAHSH